MENKDAAVEFLNQYVEDAKRTEPQCPVDIITDRLLLKSAIAIFISSGRILDQIKKNVFYGREIDVTRFLSDLNVIYSDSDGMFNLFNEDEGKDVLVMQKEKIDINDRLFHAVIGIATEATELMESLDEGFPDKANLLEELGDINWYEAIAIDEINGNFAEILRGNIEKLRRRYPEKFDAERANVRDHGSEREVLDAMASD